MGPGDLIDANVRSVAINDAGAAAVAWLSAPDEHAGPSPTPAVLHVAYRPAGEAWGRPFAVFKTQARFPEPTSVAITPGGRVMVAYRIGSGVFMRTRLPLRGWVAPVRLAFGERRGAGGVPELTVAPDGRHAVVMWRTPGSSALRAAHYQRERWGRPQFVTRGVTPRGWDVSLSQARAPFVGWLDQNGDLVTGRWHPSTGRVSSRVVLARAETARRAVRIQMASSPHGDTAMAWTQPNDRTTEFLDVAYRPRSGGWSTPHRADARPQRFIPFAVGVRSDGRVDLVWTRETNSRLLYSSLDP